MVDCSHGNSGKDPRRQIAVAADLARRRAEGDETVFGVMLESHLLEGRQAPGSAISPPRSGMRSANSPSGVNGYVSRRGCTTSARSPSPTRRC